MNASFNTLRCCLLFGACATVFSIPALSQHTNAKASSCQDAATTADMASCYGQASQAADKDLNAYYQLVAKHLQGNDLVSLREVEKAWIGYRDLNCNAEKGLYDGGSAAGPVYLACMEAVTRARLTELKRIYDERVNQ